MLNESPEAARKGGKSAHYADQFKVSLFETKGVPRKRTFRELFRGEGGETQKTTMKGRQYKKREQRFCPPEEKSVLQMLHGLHSYHIR